MNRKQRFIKWVASWFKIEIYFEQVAPLAIPQNPFVIHEKRFEPFIVEARQEFDRRQVERMIELGINIQDKMINEICRHIYGVYKDDFEVEQINSPIERTIEYAVRLEIWKERK